MTYEPDGTLAPEPPVEGPQWLPEILNAAGAAWCLLRHAPDAPAGGQDVDVLVEPRGHAVVVAELHRRGFVTLPTPGRGRRRFWIRYDAAADAWPKVDVVTRLSFGPHKEISTDLAPGVLERRHAWDGGLWTPTAHDAFWLLLLHVTLDKGMVNDQHRARLTVLLPAAHAADDHERLERFVPLPEVTRDALRRHVAGGQWTALEALGRDVLRALRRRQRVGSWGRRQSRRVVRRADRLGLVPGARLSVAVLAPDDGLRRRLVDAICSMPVPCVIETGSRLADRFRSPAGGIVISKDTSADLLIVIAEPQEHATVHTAGAQRTVLDATLPPDELRRRTVEAVWNRYASSVGGSQRLHGVTR